MILIAAAHIALILYKDGERRYVIAPAGLNKGDEVVTLALILKLKRVIVYL